eukprot:43117-Rhodomonas_salina.2
MVIQVPSIAIMHSNDLASILASLPSPSLSKDSSCGTVFIAMYPRALQCPYIYNGNASNCGTVLVRCPRALPTLHTATTNCTARARVQFEKQRAWYGARAAESIREATCLVQTVRRVHGF